MEFYTMRPPFANGRYPAKAKTIHGPRSWTDFIGIYPINTQPRQDSKETESVYR